MTRICLQSTLQSIQKSDRIFGSGCVESIQFDSENDKGLHLMSDVFFAMVHILDMNNGSQTRHDRPVIIKVHLNSSIYEGFMHDMFVTESVMYNEVLPLLIGDEQRLSSLFPKCYYGRAVGDPGLEDLIVLEDLRFEGYRVAVTKQNLFLDDQHISLALRKLGQFHGLSYRYKQKYNDLEKRCQKLKKMKFSKVWFDQSFGLIPTFMKRAIQRLTTENKHKDLLEKFLEKLSDYERFLDILTTVQEPFAVIVHGDFQKNNMAFLYDAQNQPIDVKLFDLQNSVYGDPSLDLAFFLYTNVEQTLRDTHWDKFIGDYWNGLTTVAPNPGYTFEQFHEHFTRQAVVGYVEPSFFVPVSIDTERMQTIKLDLSVTVEEKLALLLELGGQTAHDIIESIVIDMVDRGYIQSFLSRSDL